MEDEKIVQKIILEMLVLIFILLKYLIPKRHLQRRSPCCRIISEYSEYRYSHVY